MKAIFRIKEYIDYKGFNNSSFEKMNKLSNGYIATQLKRNADLGEGVLTKILNNCLDINIQWLLTGKGEMLVMESKSIGDFNIEKDKGIYEITKFLYENDNVLTKSPLFNQYIKSHIDLINIKEKEEELIKKKKMIKESLLKTINMNKKSM